MNRRQLSISDIASLYSDMEADLLEADPGAETDRCASCGSPLPEQRDELFPPSCPACGRVVEDVE